MGLRAGWTSPKSQATEPPGHQARSSPAGAFQRLTREEDIAAVTHGSRASLPASDGLEELPGDELAGHGTTISCEARGRWRLKSIKGRDDPPPTCRLRF